MDLSPHAKLLRQPFTASLNKKEDVCLFMQLLVGTHCGCAPVKNHCVFCNGAEPLNEEYEDVEFNFLQNEEFGTNNLGLNATCKILYMTQYQMPGDHEYCLATEHITFHCGCNDGVFEYSGADTVSKQAASSWIARAVGSLSLVGSILILRGILKRKSIYHQHVSTMAGLILLHLLSGSLAQQLCIQWILEQALNLEFTELTETKELVQYCPRFLLSIRSEQHHHLCHQVMFKIISPNCFSSTGFTLVFMNVSLSVYYYLIVALGLQEQRLKRLWTCFCCCSAQWH
jgi:hypothetical protein